MTITDSTDIDLETFVAGLPKCELHCHIEGTLEPELKLTLAARNGVTLPEATPEAVRETYTFTSLATFLTIYYDGMRVLLTEDDFFDLAMAYLTRAASENVRYVEFFFDPQAHTARGVAFGTVIRGLRRAAVTARRDLGIHAELIMCFLRDLTADYAMATLMESLQYKDWILGVGLDSDEHDNPPSKFAAVFERARAEGYFLTMHCDVDQKDTTVHIRQCLDLIGVDRIDHGINAIEDPGLVTDLVERGIGLTVCPVSNSFAAGGMHAQETVDLLEAGVKVTVNSDDPAYFASYMHNNLVEFARVAKLTREQLVRIERNAFEIAWLPDRARERYLTELEAYATAHP